MSRSMTEKDRKSLSDIRMEHGSEYVRKVADGIRENVVVFNQFPLDVWGIIHGYMFYECKTCGSSMVFDADSCSMKCLILSVKKKVIP